MTEFRVNPALEIITSDSTQCLDKSLKVAQSFSTSSIMSRKMNYAQGLQKQFVYSESQWADSPNRTINEQIVKLIRDTKLFKSVLTSKSRSKSDLILEINIEDFMQYFSEDSSESYAEATISLSLIESDTNSVIASKTFDSRVDAKSLDAHGGVEALNSALEDILAQTNSWLSGVCK
jgi:cholesterol transport system auxiliary component